MFEYYLILLNICLCVNQCLAKDATLTEGANGLDVVEAVVENIKDSGIFDDDNGIMKRIAYVESRFGQNAAVLHEDNGGGIWQINEAVYKMIGQNWETNEELNQIISKIKTNLSIDVKEAKFVSLKMPIYSGIFARIYLWLIKTQIPDQADVEGHAAYWKNNYNKNGTIKTFVEDIDKLEAQFECKVRMDLGIVMDGSGSIGEQSYQKALTFVDSLVQTFSLESVRIGFVVFSADAKVVFNLTTDQSVDQMHKMIMNSEYPSLGTCTQKGINSAIEILTKVDQREGIPKIIAIFTDGQPACQNIWMELEEVVNLDRVVVNNITVFAIGIGSDIDQDKLLSFANNIPKHVFKITSYEILSKSFKLLNSETYKIPQKPVISKNLTDVLVKSEKRYFHYNCPHEGINIKTLDHSGRTRSYYSCELVNPSSALNDGEFVGQVFIPYRAPNSNKRKKRDISYDSEPINVFVTVQGEEDNNNYTILSEQGNHVSAAVSIISSMINFLSILFLFL